MPIVLDVLDVLTKRVVRPVRRRDHALAGFFKTLVRTRCAQITAATCDLRRPCTTTVYRDCPPAVLLYDAVDFIARHRHEIGL